MLGRFAYSFASKGTIALINFAILLFSARYLGLRTRGDISIFLVNIAIVQFINEVYTGNNLIHFLKNYGSRKIISQALLFTLIVVLLASFILSYTGAQPFVTTWQYLAVIGAVLLHSFFCIIVLGLDKLRAYNALAILQPVLLLVYIIIQVKVFNGYTFKHYYYSLLFSFLTALPFSFYRVVKVLKLSPAKGTHSIRQLVSNGLFLQSTALMLFLMNRYNYYLLSENAKVGLYATGSMLMEALLLVANGTVPVLLSTLSKEKQNSAIVISVLKLAILLLLPLVILVLCVPEHFYLSLIGSGFIGIKTVMLTYAPAVVLQCMCIIIAQYFSAFAKQAVLAKAYLPAFFITLLIAPFAIERWALSGAALSTGIGFMLAFVILYISFCKQTGTPATVLFKKETLASLLNVLRATN